MFLEMERLTFGCAAPEVPRLAYCTVCAEINAWTLPCYSIFLVFHSESSTHLEDRAKEAATRLETALAAGYGPANLHLAHLAFDAGVEDRALAHLKDYLSRLVARGRDRCDGCSQKRGEDAPMLTCSGCRVARFCSADHQKMASKSVAAGGNVWTGRHKDICGLLGKWRGVEKDGVSPDSLRADLLEFLRQRQ